MKRKKDAGGGKGNMSTKQLVDLMGRRNKTMTVLFSTCVLLGDPFERFVFGFVYARDLIYCGIDLLLQPLGFFLLACSCTHLLSFFDTAL